METSIDGIIVVDKDGKIILYNHRFLQMWHLQEKRLVTESSEKILNYMFSLLKEPEKYENKAEELFSPSKEKRRGEIELKDGRVFDRYSSQMLDNSGRYLGRIWYFHDISDYKKTERDLKKSEETFHLIMEMEDYSAR